MKKFLRIEFFPQTVLRICLLLVFVSLCGNTLMAQKIRVDNIRYELKGDNIEIMYDLAGLPEKEYKVSVALKREQSPGFLVKPKSLSGDIGKGKFAGTDRKIIWSYVDEFKPGEGINDYYFEVTAKKPSKAWIFILGGGVVVGGGIVAAILLTGKKDEPASDPFPIPARP